MRPCTDQQWRKHDARTMKDENYSRVHQSCVSEVADVVSTRPTHCTCQWCDERRPCLPTTWTPRSTSTHTHRRLLHVTTQTEMSSCNISTSRQTYFTAATFDNVASSKTLAWSLTSSKVQQKSNHQKLFCCLLSYHFLPHPVSHGLYAVTAGKNNMGALFYSLVDFTDASHLNTLMQVWCIAEINRWINNAPYTTSRNPWHKQVL